MENLTSVCFVFCLFVALRFVTQKMPPEMNTFLGYLHIYLPNKTTYERITRVVPFVIFPTKYLSRRMAIINYSIIDALRKSM